MANGMSGPAQWAAMQNQRQDDAFRQMMNTLLMGKQFQQRQSEQDWRQQASEKDFGLRQENLNLRRGEYDIAQKKVGPDIEYTKALTEKARRPPEPPEQKLWQVQLVAAQKLLENNKVTQDEFDYFSTTHRWPTEKGSTDYSRKKADIARMIREKILTPEEGRAALKSLVGVPQEQPVSQTAILNLRKANDTYVRNTFKKLDPDDYSNKRVYSAYKTAGVDLDYPLEYSIAKLNLRQPGVGTQDDVAYIEKAEKTRDYFYAALSKFGKKLELQDVINAGHIEKNDLDPGVLNHLFTYKKDIRKRNN